MMVAIIVSAIFKASFGSEFYSQYAVVMLVVIIGVAEWPQYARTIRASVLAEKKKEELDREMSLMQDKNSLEFGLIANDLDAELKKMAEESEIAKKRNEALKEELRLLAEELARGTSRASRREKGVNAVDVDRKKEKEVNPLTRKLADEEAMNTDEKMRKTLAETQRGATFFMLKLLLGIVVIFELARGEFAVSSALAAALALVFYQSEAEKANEGPSE